RLHASSAGDMTHTPGCARSCASVTVSLAMMLPLAMADNLALSFVGWEGVGPCSYLLIGFWYTDAAKAWAGRKAFITNRIGDFAFVIGMILLTLTVAAFQAQTNDPRNLNFGTAGTSNAQRVRWITPNGAVGPPIYSRLA